MHTLKNKKRYKHLKINIFTKENEGQEGKIGHFWE
jgi:hypothetical protein